MVTLQVKAQPFARNQAHKVYFELSKRCILQGSAAYTFSVTTRVQKENSRFGTYVYKARADHVDHIFCQTVIQQRTRNSCELNYQVPLAKQH